MKRKILFAVACVASYVSSASGALVTSDGSFGPKTIIDFSQFNTTFNFTAGPIQVGGLVGKDIEWSSTTSNSVIGNSGYGLSSNGEWTSSRIGFVGLNSGSGDSMRFDFNDGPVSAVGGFVNYAPGFNLFFLEALDINNVVLESYNIFINTTGQDDGVFRGIQRTSSDISALRIKGGYAVLDDLTFSADVEPTPEPTSLAIFGIGALCFGGAAARRRRKEKQAAEA